MQLIESSGSSSEVANPLTEILSDKAYKQLKSILAAANLTEEAFTSSPHSYLFLDETGLTAAWKRDICGLRLTIVGASPSQHWAQQSANRLIRSTARKDGCNLIQALLQPSELAPPANIPDLGFITNYVFERQVGTRINTASKSSTSSPTVQQIKHPPDWLLAHGPTLEFNTRWQHPGSTFHRSDTLVALKSEYQDYQTMIEEGEAALHALTDNPSSGFILSVLNTQSRNAIIAHIWIDPNQRSKGLGSTLLSTAISYLFHDRKMESVSYFVANQNYPAMKMLRANGFSLKYLVINQTL